MRLGRYAVSGKNYVVSDTATDSDTPDTGESDTPAIPAAHQYGDVAAVYDALMSGVPHDIWLRRIERAVRLRGRNPVSALDVACGTGIVTGLLYRRGYRPTVGVDISPAMVGIARTKAAARGQSDLPFLVQDAAELDLHGQRFDLAVSMFDSLNYIVEPARLLRAFQAVYRHLNPGGVFAFDMNSLYALSHDMFSQHSDIGPVRHDWRAHWDRETRICRVEMDFWITDRETGDERFFHETHIQRAYTVPEITEWLEQAGFVRVECFGNYGDRAPNAKSDRLLFVGEKEG